MSNKNKKTRVVINKQTLLKSIVADLITFIIMSIAFWFNYMFIGGNNFFDTIILLSLLVFSCKYADHNRHYGISDEDIKKIEKICKKEEE